MDVTRQKQKELQDNFSWMQPVSNKPSIPNVCYTDIEGNPLGQEYWLGPGQCYPGYFTAEARTAPATALLESVNYSQTPNFGGDACHIGACREGSQLNASRWDNIPFGSLLALANSASTSTCSVSNNNGGFSYRANPWICYDFMGRHPYDFAVPQRPAHNPNPPPEMSSTFFSNKGFQFVSETPDNVTTSMPGKADEQSHRQEELKAGAGYDTNCHQSDKELSITDTGLSIAATSTPNEEKQNEKGEGHSMDTSKTPQLKVKRKRHRPKVIIQGKPGTQAPVTPKPAAAENSTTDVRRGRKKTALNGEPTTTPSGKRKYVRKKPVHDSTSPTAEVTGTSVDTETVELVKRSCRKVLDFDENEQAVDGSSNCNSVFPGFASTPQSGTTLPTDVGGGTDAMAQNGTDGEESTFIVHIGQGVEVMLGRMLDLSQSVDQMQKDYISSVQIQAQGKSVLDATNIPQKERPVSSEQNSKNRTHGRADILSQFEEWISQPSRNVSNCSTSGEEQDRNMTISLPMRPPDASLNNLAGIHYHSSASYPLESSAHFPVIGKKVRTAEVQYLSSSSKTSVAAPTNDELRVESTCQAHNFKSDALSFWTSVCHNASGHSSAPRNVYPCLQYDLQNTGNALPQTEKSKKRSRAQPKVRDLASLDKTLFSEAQPNKSVPHASMEVVVAESCAPSAKKKRTKKSALITKEVQPYEIITFHQNSFSVASLGTRPELLCKQIVSVDMIAEQLQNLDIQRESSVAMSRVENSLVPYNLENNALTLYKDGTIVPFEPAKKRRPRAKVHLDEETSRVWRLLLENINNEGIDGTDEENTKYWEEERRVFTGRANSFTARMRLVQGDRRFSPWKGSVVDSVVGVFLTQNVSDHLSSSAFMSLAANFPLKERGRFNTCSEDSTSSVINKPIMHISDPDDVAKWSEEMTTQSFCNQSPRSLRDFELDDEREVVNSSELSESTSHVLASGTALDYCDSVADRSSTEILEIEGVLSSQNSVSPSVEAASRKESQSEDNSKTKDTRSGPELHNSNSCTFMELLRKAGCPMLNEVHSHENSSILSDKNTDDDYIKSGSMRNELQSQKTSNSDSPQSCLEDSVVTSSNCCSDPTYVSGLPEAESLKMTTDERTNHDIFMKKDQNSVKDDGAFVTESVGHKVTEHSEQVMIYQEASGSPITGNSLSTSIQEDEQQPVPSRSSNLQGHDSRGKSVVQSTNNEMDQKLKLPEGILDITESTSRNRENNPQEADASGSVENVQGNKELQGIEEAKRKAKSRRVGREIKDNVDWDAFRKQAEANGKKRERKENTMDSLDYEAVRAADVNEVANTIKERGMNNRLAARIKDMLDRLVREHGSVDLEWLRDIAPDQAKEFLLSIKGLGLKSVECVRLLTLHHVAFPVDTNVGRIVVRLGWVPLQPLPESLQLHLLELYPVLESIQQYLWPRLCKLDQKTLYELHYQMITFGKVFCTKSKPNCNACPMRGECRHFASAFASARLALPGPEEKSVVCTTQNNTTENNTSTGMPSVLVDSLPPLPLPQGAEQSALSKFSEILQTESKNRASNHEPIIEEPASPEPECAEVTDKDMEDMFTEDPDEIPTIKLNIEEFTQNLQNYMQENMELQEGAMSKALVALTAEVASIPVPKLKNMSQLRTEHQVYELPDSHPLLKELERREPDDPCTYLLAIWSPGETENSIYPPEKKCSSQECGSLCDEKTCYSCNSVREANSQIVRGTILIPCRTAMRGSFPLNGTYFQVNEVFADHESSLNPIDVPRSWIWNLPRRTVYFGTSVPSIFKGLTTEEIQQCFWRGYVCVRGFDRKSRAPRPLKARLHFPASKLKNRGKKPEE